ncbi:hypothetical protein RM780_09755 [Streptomyces sp. DSM 44917]|uniref:Uncharacterized protein n=1 Tax=Streptomyces boetiae TaxID=3075541 RepID=A0ABU2L6R2_9ACTN|nr:hypothetical protein [Streptomyces sp. DSM 44917]MDT0307246.1 hypothetical protein [Streptomyces sp. DSM 44917]
MKPRCEGHFIRRYEYLEEETIRCLHDAVYRVEWIALPVYDPGVAELVRKVACGTHLAKIVRQGLEHRAQEVHVLPIGSPWEWWTP